MVKHIFIITGGRVDIPWLRACFPAWLKKEEESVVIAADRGLLYAKEAGLCVDKALGDFDSLPGKVLWEYQEKGIEIRGYPPEKDYTDTHLALLWALEERADKVTILGGIGSRFDHSLANIGLLSLLLEKGVRGEIVDEHNRILMMDREHTGTLRLKRSEERREFISLIPYTQEVTGICLSGFRYPLQEETLAIGASRGISNELVKEAGAIRLKEGILLVIRSWD